MEYALKSVQGQHKDLLNSCKTESDYIEMSVEKSGSLVALVCVIGALLATDDYPVDDRDLCKKYWIDRTDK